MLPGDNPMPAISTQSGTKKLASEYFAAHNVIERKLHSDTFVVFGSTWHLLPPPRQLDGQASTAAVTSYTGWRESKGVKEGLQN